MQIRPFSEINAYFRLKLSDPSMCLSGDKEFSFLKVLQHGLSYAMIGDRSKLIRNYVHFPFVVHAGILNLKSLLKPVTRKNAINAQSVIIDPGRVVIDEFGKPHSVYFEKVSSCLGAEGCYTILKKKTEGIKSDDCLTNHLHQYPAMDGHERRMLKRVHSIAGNVKKSGNFSNEELAYIQSCLHIFFDEFRFYYQLFKNSSVKKVYFICHYHNEGLLAALKILNIESIELQHGLISGNDLYYVYDPCFSEACKNAFFPDKILVYGSYWKNVLARGCEFSETQIDIAGDYLYRKTSAQTTRQEKENLILICAQKGMHENYINYAVHLAQIIQSHPDWKIILKLHPLETQHSSYDVLKDHEIEIAPLLSSLDELLYKAKIQISIYSTTFYDAIGFDVLNLSIQNFGTSSDYASSVASEGVAMPINYDDDPIAIYKSSDFSAGATLQRTDIYADFNCELLKNA